MNITPVASDLCNQLRGSTEVIANADLVFQPVGSGRSLVHKYRFGDAPCVVDTETLEAMHDGTSNVVRIVPSANGMFDAHIMRNWNRQDS